MLFFRRWKQSIIIYFTKGLLGQPQIRTRAEVTWTPLWLLNISDHSAFDSVSFLPQIRNRVAEVPASCDDGASLLSVTCSAQACLPHCWTPPSKNEGNILTRPRFCQHSSIREDGLSPLSLTCPKYMSLFQWTWAAQSLLLPRQP